MRDVVDSLARTPLSKVLVFVAICSILRIAIYPLLSKTPAHQRSGLYTGGKILNEIVDALVYAGVFVFFLIRPFGVQAFLIPSGSMCQTLQVNDFIVANKAVYRYSEPEFQDIVVFRPPARAATRAGDIDGNGEVKIDYIKRLIGLPGDIIEIKDNVLYRNGEVVDEPYKTFSRAATPGPNPREYIDLTDQEREQLMQTSTEFPDFKLVEYQGEIWPVTYDDSYVNLNSAKDYKVINDAQLATILRSSPPTKIPPGQYLMIGDNRNNSFDGRYWGLIDRSAIIGRSEFVWFPLKRWQMTR